MAVGTACPTMGVYNNTLLALAMHGAKQNALFSQSGFQNAIKGSGCAPALRAWVLAAGRGMK